MTPTQQPSPRRISGVRDPEAFDRLVNRLASFELVSRTIVDPASRTAYAFTVEARQTFRLVTVDAGQIVDTMIYNAHAPTERYDAGAQFALEGVHITTGTTIWGSAPHTRPLALVIADSVSHAGRSGSPGPHPQHISIGGHCNPHHYAGASPAAPQSCYDNFRAALGSAGLSQRWADDNMNIYSNSTLDPTTGHYTLQPSTAGPGDYIEFYAEIDLLVAISLCPAAGGGVVDGSSGWDGSQTLHAIGVEVRDSGVPASGSDDTPSGTPGWT